MSLDWNIDSSWSLFLDRDGVINERPINDYVLEWEKFHFRPDVLSSFAALCAKFMMIGKAIFPLRVDANRGLFKSIFWHSLAYLGIVLALSFAEAGIDGLFHGKSFLESLSSFGHGDPIYIAAVSLMYWLILWPYLIVLGLNQSLGDKTVHAILFGSKEK